MEAKVKQYSISQRKASLTAVGTEKWNELSWEERLEHLRNEHPGAEQEKIKENCSKPFIRRRSSKYQDWDKEATHLAAIWSQVEEVASRELQQLGRGYLNRMKLGGVLTITINTSADSKDSLLGFQTVGTIVTSVLFGSSAYISGLREGMLIMCVSDIPTPTSSSLVDAIGNFSGDKLILIVKVMRKGSPACIWCQSTGFCKPPQHAEEYRVRRDCCSVS